MAHYLIVTHKTASAPELRVKVSELIAEDPSAEFGILVPATPGEGSTWEGEAIDSSREIAEKLAGTLETTLGAKVTRIATGPEDPLQAITTQLQPGHSYDTLLICTLPLGASQWLRFDLVTKAQRKYGLPVIHVVGTVGPD